jgi:hypothetical protein
VAPCLARGVAAGVGVLLALALTGCLPEDIGGAFIIKNDSDQRVFFGTANIDPGSRYVLSGLSGDGCGRPGLKLYDQRGDVVIRLKQQWCAGQVLTFHGPGDYTLTSVSD